MQRTFVRDSRNKGYEDDELRSGKPIPLKPAKEFRTCRKAGWNRKGRIPKDIASGSSTHKTKKASVEPSAFIVAGHCPVFDYEHCRPRSGSPDIVRENWSDADAQKKLVRCFSILFSRQFQTISILIAELASTITIRVVLNLTLTLEKCPLNPFKRV